MAYIVFGKRPLVFVANPRTGSTAVANALKTMGAQVSGNHHSQPFYIPPGSIVFQVVRNHFDVLNSFWWKSKPTGNFERFIDLALAGGYEYIKVPRMYWRFGITHTIQYDSMVEDFKWLCGIVDLKPVPLLRTPSRTQRTAQDMFSPHIAQRVQEVYREEMEEFSWTF